MNDEEYIRQSVRRRVGIAALNCLRRMAEDDERQRAANAWWARRMTGLVLVVALGAVVWFAVSWHQ